MIIKIVKLSAVALGIATMISCEKDFTEVGTSIINNGEFSSNDTILPIKITSEDISAVQANDFGNIADFQYLLGVYKTDYYKKITASIVSQVGYRGSLVTSQSSEKDTDYEGVETNIDSIYTLDKVLIRLPYPSKRVDNKIELESVLGNTTVPTKLQVFENKTFLNTLDPKNPAQKNKYMSDAVFLQGENLTEKTTFSFTPKASDTIYSFERTKIIDGQPVTFKDEIKFYDVTDGAKKAQKAFMVIPLKKDRMKALFWDKFNDAEFTSSEAFKNYFRGLIIKTEGDDGSLVPFNFSESANIPTLDFYYTITRIENGKHKDTIPSRYSFKLNGIRNSIYKTEKATSTAPANNVAIQGTAGSKGNITILTKQQIEELREKKWLINDASVTFFVNQSVDKDTTLVPQRLMLYKNTKNDKGQIVPVQLSDSYKEANYFGGYLTNSDKKPNKYTIRITDYISDVLNGKQELVPLTLKVYNFNTDSPVQNNQLDTIVKTYNWNPRGVMLLDGSSANGDKKASLKITYSKQK